MTPITASSSRSRPAADRAELHRIAAALTRAEGWEAAGPPADDPGGGVCLRVSGAAVHREARLRVRERRPGDPEVLGGAELTARRQTASEHVLGLVREVGRRRLRGREVEAVLLTDAPGGTLGELLARRPGLSGGEAATVLLGVARGVAALHSSGWAASSLEPAGVEFTADGCPALGLLDGVVTLHPEAAVADAEAYHALARSLCLRVVDGTGMRLLAAVEGGLRTGRWAAVEEAVTAVAQPVSVRLGEVGASGRDVSAGSGVGASGAAPPHSGAAPASAAARRSRRGRDAGARVAAVVDALDGQPLRQVGSRLVGVLRRRPLLAVVGAVPVVLALAMVASIPDASGRADALSGSRSATIPPTGDSRAAAQTGGIGESNGRAGASGDGAARDDAVGGTTSATGATAPAPGPSTSTASATQGEGTTAGAGGGDRERAGGDDPVDAARGLLDARHACFTAKRADAGCLDDILESGGGLQAEEAAALGQSGAREERDYTGAQLSLVERWGDAALVAVVPASSRTPKSEPASLLLVRSEAGWRLRAVFP